MSGSFGNSGTDRNARFHALATEANAALARQDLAHAIEVARTALKEQHYNPVFFNLLAMDAMRKNLPREAITALERGNAMFPNEPNMLNMLGVAHFTLGEHTSAENAYNAAIAAKPDFAPPYYGRGTVREAAGDLPAAREDYAKAVTLQPNYAEALARLAYVEAQHGNNDMARQYAIKALSLSPREHSAHLAHAIADMADEKLEAAASRLDQLLADPKLGPVNRSLAFGLLGDARHGLSQYDSALDCYRRSKDMVREADASRYGGGQALAEAQCLASYLKGITWQADKSASADPNCAKHVFLVGFPRSGTTLLEQALAGHPDIVSTDERTLQSDVVRAFDLSPESLTLLSNISPVDALRYRDAYWKRAVEAGFQPRGKVFLDKLPLNTLVLPHIAKLFPHAKILFALRDPRDVVFSAFRRRFAMSAQMYQFTALASAAAYYDAVMSAGIAAKGKLALDWLDVRHEDFVADPDAQTKSISAFLGLPWNDAMLKFTARVRARAVSTPSTGQIARGLNRDGFGSWRPYAVHLTDVLPVLEPWVQRFGYSP